MRKANQTIAYGTSSTVINSNAASLKTFIADLKSLIKFVVLMLNVLPVLTGYLLAIYFMDLSLADHFGSLLLTIGGSTFVMAGALIINNWYEVDLDTKMVRTEQRPTVTGNISLPTVLKMGISTTVIGFILLFFTTIEAVIWAFVGWFTYVVLYTFWSKRRYTINTIIGSVSGAVTPLIGWGAIASNFHIVPIMLFLILFIWQVPHTFAIAMRRYDDYKAAGVPMLPVVAGFEMTKRQMVIYIAALLPIPFFLTSLGIAFVTVATILNILWLALGFKGFFVQNDVKWANLMFKSSLIYCTIIFLMMIFVTFYGDSPSLL